jgi:hypothetical protein
MVGAVAKQWADALELHGEGTCRSKKKVQSIGATAKAQGARILNRADYNESLG